MTLKNFLKPRAFSLIEISVVIIIIGIFIAGVVVADGMVSKFRIAAAKNLTQSSPISTFKDAALWLESSLDSSFNSSEAQNGASLSTWYDQKNSPNKVIVNTAGVSPTYSNTINRVHAVEFDGTSNKHFTFDGSFLNGTDYTIMILEKRKSSKSNNYFLGTPGSGLNNSLSLGYSANNQIIHAQGSNSYPSGISAYSSSKDAPRVFIFTHSSSYGNQTYINGVLAAENTDPAALAHLSGIGTVSIGQDYVGEIGEIAILTSALSVSDRKLAEDYLGKKWTSSINSNKVANCIGGLVTTSGCDNSSPVTCTASGTGYNKTNLSYTSGSSFSCDSGYAGTISYKCLASGPASNVSGACAPITCTAPAGSGYSAQTGLTYSTGSGTFNCDAGYAGVKTYTCTTSGPATISGACTAITCSIASVTGFNNNASLAYASSATAIPSACASGYSGSPTYTCTTSGPATISGACTASGVCGSAASNGAGGTFNATGLSTNSAYALKACESVYGVGACSSGSCGHFTYYYRTSQGHCSCSKAAGTYEWIYNNTGYIQVGQDYGGDATNVSGDKMFVRLKNNASCNSTTWSLALKDFVSTCNGVVP
jgi:prepilin-type N-terminal cleavage/methylation domain-containing protein